MNKPTMTLVLSALVALLASPLAAAQSTASANSMHALQDGQTQAQGSPTTHQGPLKPGDRACLQSTGSLIPAGHRDCLGVPGRSYSRQDIQNTGEPTLGPALQKLDPSVTIRGGH